MKKITLLCALAALAIGKINYEEVDKKFEEIAKQRTTIDDATISKISNPFFKPSSSIANAEQLSFSLQAIVEKRAKINGNWYKIGEEIASGFKVVSVRNDTVGISDSNIYKELNLKDNKNVSIYKK